MRVYLIQQTKMNNNFRVFATELLIHVVAVDPRRSLNANPDFYLLLRMQHNAVSAQHAVCQ